MTEGSIRFSSDALRDVFRGEADYRGAYGGRGSGKTRAFATMSAVRGYEWSMAQQPGIIVCGREYMNTLDESSFSEVKAAIQAEPWLNDHYDCGEKYIRTKDGFIEYDFVGLKQNLNSIKSKAHIKLLWVDEAEPVSETAWAKAIPTVREEGSEIWVTWNPESNKSPTHKRFRVDPPQRSKIIELNWRDNKFFPATLDRKRLEDQEKRPDSYEWIWEGGFLTSQPGAYYAKQLTQARAQKRICRVGQDPMVSLRAYCDIGGAGAKADAMVIWIVQFVGREIRLLDYIEGVGQVQGYYAEELRSRGWKNAEIILPHDGVNTNNITGKRYKDHWEDAGFNARVIENQGQGAAMMRIEAGRRLFPQCWFNETTCQAGLDALGAYHEKRDEKRGDVGLGPEHDWASHGADAFGLMAIDYEEPRKHVQHLIVPRVATV